MQQIGRSSLVLYGIAALSLISVPATTLSPAAVATGSVVAAQAAVAGTGDVDGSKSHLPALSATTSYHAGAGLADQIRAYRTSGDYVADRNRITKRATAFLDAWLQKKCKPSGCTPAIVFDFDDTLVSWYEILNTTHFTSNSAVTGPAMRDCTTPPIVETIGLLKHAQKMGVQVYVITGRTESMRAVTEACMAKIGVTAATLILLQPHQENLTAKVFKSQERAKLEKGGKTIALSIGDQVSDVAGGFTAGTFVVPNPMYFIP